VAISDGDRDSLHVLPLAIVPLKTPALCRARMIKNVRLQAVVELFSDEQSGSGQMDIEDVPKELCWPSVPPHPDLIVLRKLALLQSYDVYSLRVLLREQGIPVNEISALRLSKTKIDELTTYMSTFTRPLIREIYGDGDTSIESFEDIVALFRDPDIRRAKSKLQAMADRLEIGILDIPGFLEDYGDIFLSLSYYRNCLDAISPIIEEFFDSLENIRTNRQLASDLGLMAVCVKIENSINGSMAAVTGRFENFDRSTDAMWDDLTAERFRKVRDLIRSYHTTIGGVLCALSVKMAAWKRLFPDANTGGPIKRAEFIMSEVRQGLDNIQRIEDSAPMLAAVA